MEAVLCQGHKYCIQNDELICLHKKHCLLRFCKNKEVFLSFSVRIRSYANLQFQLLGLEIPYLVQELLNNSKSLSIIRKGK